MNSPMVRPVAVEEFVQSLQTLRHEQINERGFEACIGTVVSSDTRAGSSF